MKSEIIYQIYDENKLFELLDDSGNWWKIRLNDGRVGFIYSSKVIKVDYGLTKTDNDEED